MTDNKSLLLFLNARGRNLPHTFAHAETHFSNPFTRTKQIDPYYGSFRMFLGKQSKTQQGDTTMYGTIAKITAADPSRRKAFLYGAVTGINILVLQREVLGFLNKCCIAILHDIPPMLLSSHDLAIQAEPPTLLGHDELRRTFTDAAKFGPYLSRNKPDFARLRYLITTVLHSVKDHAWQMREDPAYFAEHVQAHANHQTENILDAKGSPHFRAGTRAFYQDVLAHDLLQIYRDLIVWDKIYEVFGQLEALATDLKDPHIEALPQKYCDTLEALYAFLIQ